MPDASTRPSVFAIPGRTDRRMIVVSGLYQGLMMWVLFRAMQVFEGRPFFEHVAVQLPVWIAFGMSSGWVLWRLRLASLPVKRGPDA